VNAPASRPGRPASRRRPTRRHTPVPLLAALVAVGALLLPGGGLAADPEPAPQPPSATAAPPPPAGTPEEVRRALDTAAAGLEVVRQSVQGQNVTLGAGVVRTTFSLVRDRKFPDGTTPSAQTTDNGRPALVAAYQTAERYVGEWPLRVGHFRLGYNTVVKLISFHTNRQTTLNEAMGEDLGTSAEGTVLAVAPVFFMLLGPVYPHRAIFWKAGFGLGAALIDYEADVLYRSNVSPHTSRERVDGDPERLNPFVHTFWNLEWERWVLAFQNYDVRGSAPGGAFFFKQVSLSLAYTFAL